MIQIDMNFFSEALGRRQRLRMMLPEMATAAPETGFPVFYLLHGFSDGCDSFLYNSALARYADGLPLCVVMPDADKSFYTDMRFGDAYQTHIFEEIPALIRRNFHVNTAPGHLFVGGVSMGGYGAAKWALQCPERFTAVFLLSPVTDIVSVVQNGFGEKADFSLEDLRLERIFDVENLKSSNDDLMFLLSHTQKTLPPFYLYCGQDDFLYSKVGTFASLLREKGASVTYLQTEGKHSWQTWEGHLENMTRVLRSML